MALNKCMHLICVLILLFAVPSSFLLAQEKIGGRDVLKGRWKNQEIEYVQGRVAVILKGGRSKANIQTVLDKHRATVIQEFDKLGWGLLDIPESEDIFPLIRELERNEHVQVAEPDQVGHISFDPNDPYFSNGTQWALKNTGQTPPGGTSDADIDAPEAWNITMGSSSIIIAILDTGIPMISGALSHPDLNDPNKFILGPDYTDPQNLNGDGVRDMHSHGSHVAGIASAETNNSTGISGVAGSCKVLIVQIFTRTGGGSASYFRNGVMYAVDNGAKVINVSGRWFSASSTLLQGVQYADNHDVLIVAAAGNENSSVGWPAASSTSYNNVIAVGATNHYDQRAGYSNYGSELNVVAPGGGEGSSIYSTTPNYPGYYWEGTVSQNYGYIRGTSQAAPHVSGVAGLLLSLAPTLTPLQVRSTLEQTAEDKGAPGRDDYYGYGRINAYNAVNLINSAPAAPHALEITNAGQNGQNPQLSWDANSEPDLDHYAIYQGYQNSGTGPIYWNSNPVATTTNTTWTDQSFTIDTSAGSDVVHYRITAVDEADNESNYSNSVSTGVGEEVPSFKSSALPKKIALKQNYPNPFNSGLRIERIWIIFFEFGIA